jgi:hypothetical protein
MRELGNIEPAPIFDPARVLARQGVSLPPGVGMQARVEGTRVRLDLVYDDSWAERVAADPPELTVSRGPGGAAMTLSWERLAPGHFTAGLDAFAESSVPVPRKRVSSSARDAFLQIVAMVALLNVAFASGSILFILIERWLPLPIDWLGRAGVATAIACIVMALALLESPLRARLLRLDADRVADLQTISRAIENYHERHGELPGSLDDLRADPRTFVRDVDDAVTGTSYGYRATGPRTYELTATFDLESPPLDAPNRGDGSQDGFFTHGPGQRTFTVTVPEKRGS